jgi:hypothetical protein
VGEEEEEVEEEVVVVVVVAVAVVGAAARAAARAVGDCVWANHSASTKESWKSAPPLPAMAPVSSRSWNCARGCGA